MNIHVFREAPFLRVLIPLIAGMAAARRLDCQVVLPGVLSILSGLLLAFTFCLCRQHVNPFFSRLFGLVLQLLFASMGAVLWGLENESRPDVLMVEYTARICSDPEEKKNSFRILVDRIEVRHDSIHTCLQGRAQVYLQKDRRCRVIRPGMRLHARGRLGALKPSPCREGFDYNTYLMGRNILYSGYLDSLAWDTVPGDRDRGLKIWALNVRHSMLDRIMGGPLPGNGRRNAVLASLLLGYRAGLTAEMKERFTRSGSMHILAISGLHVGILYLLPSLVLRQIRQRRALHAAGTVISILLLWIYALVTGMSTSVTRAAGMCSLHAVAGLTRRAAGWLHLLSLAAFVMILVRPPVLFEAGFQLSFCAVAGIAGFYRRLCSLFTFSRSLPAWCWKMTCLSLSAQFGTAPLVIHHFQVYPFYSLLSNLVVVPLATLILYCGVLFFSLSWFAPLAKLFYLILQCLGGALAGFTGVVSGLPGAVCSGLSLSPLQVLLLYAFILMLALFLNGRENGFLLASLFFLFVFLGVSNLRACGLTRMQAEGAQHGAYHTIVSGFLPDGIPGRTQKDQKLWIIPLIMS